MQIRLFTEGSEFETIELNRQHDELPRCKGSRAQLIDNRDNFPKISVLFICLGYALSRFKKAVILSHLKGLEILRSSFCEQVIRHGSEIFLVFCSIRANIVENTSPNIDYIRRKTNSEPNKNCCVFTSSQQSSQMLIVLRNYSRYRFYGIVIFTA